MAHIKRNTEATLVGTMTLAEAHDMFMEEKKATNLSESTIKNYDSAFLRFTETIGVDPDVEMIGSLTPQDIYHFINGMKQKDIGPTSINGYLMSLRSFLYWCMDDTRGYIKKPFKIPTIRCQEEPLKFFDDDEVQKLLMKPNPGDSFGEWRMWAVVNWILGTANRVKTCCSVKMKDLDFKNKEIVIESQKNKKAQIIPMSSALEIALKEYIRLWRYDTNGEDYLFCSITENGINPKSLGAAFARYCKSRGVEKTSIHGLRHTYARCFIRNGGNPLILQKMLNHSTLEMTKRYVALFTADMRDEINMYNPLDVIKKNTNRTKRVGK